MEQIAIKSVTFYFANPMTDEKGVPVVSNPPESHTLTWQQVKDNVGFSLSTGESMFTELDPDNDHIITVVNGFYFGSGHFGSLLAIQYLYEDESDGWIKEILVKTDKAENSDIMIGNWTKGLSYQEISTNEKWKGKPYIGSENSYIKFRIERVLPDMMLSLLPEKKTIYKGESITFDFNTIDYCDGDVTYEWTYNKNVIEELSKTDKLVMLQFKQAGTHNVQLTAKNECGQSVSKTAIVTVEEPAELPCDIQLTPSTITIRLGETATFTAIHPYSEKETWMYDLSLEIVEKTNRKLQVKPKALGSYSISYKVKDCQANALLYVLEPVPDGGGGEDPVEPPPPALPNTPPDSTGSPDMIIDLLDATKPASTLHKYPHLMKRNARYRGPRESEKHLSSHQEQIYDIRRIHKDLSSMDEKAKVIIDSWFNSEGISSIIKNEGASATISKTNEVQSEDTLTEPMRAKNTDMLQLGRKSLENRIVGTYSIKQRMQQLDERIAEVERGYKNYENAYE